MTDQPNPPATKGATTPRKRKPAARPQKVILAYSQSNFRNTAKHDWTPPPNLFVFNGGLDGVTGTGFVPCPDDQMRVPYATVGHMAEADPGTDHYLLICATGGVGVRAVLGMPYIWSSSLTGDPGPGALGLDSSTAGEASAIRYSDIDAEGQVRFRDANDLGETQRSDSVARIMVGGHGDPQMRFRTLGPRVADAGWRAQPIAVVAAPDWPPADGTRLTLYPALENMAAVIQRNSKAVFDALGRKNPGKRVYDLVLIWPTEADVAYVQAYVEADHDRLMTFLSRWTNDATRFVYTLPWPHHPVPRTARAIRRWWAGIASVVARDPLRRALVSLEETEISDWRDDGNIHTGGGESKARIGWMIAEGAEPGMVDLSRWLKPEPEPEPEPMPKPSLLRRIKRKLGL